MSVQGNGELEHEFSAHSLSYRAVSMTGSNARWALMALVISTGSILVLCHGLLGTGPIFTCMFIFASTAALILLGRTSDIELNFCDVCFFVFLCCVLISSVINGIADAKEFGLLFLSLAAYPAGRLFSGGAIKPVFLRTTAVIVLVGAALTVYALLERAAPRGKPMVFGEFQAAPVQFLASLAFLLFGLIASGLNAKKARATLALVLPSMAVFAAAIVRFTFVAIGASLLAAVIVAPRKERKYVALIIAVLVSAVAAGLLTRYSSSAKSLYEATVLLSPSSMETVCPIPETENSVIIRRQLVQDAFRILPEAGLFGIGLGGFKTRSCVPGFEVHNSILQSFVEFGWLGGAFFSLSIVLAFAGLPWRSPDPESVFVICGLTFAVTMSFAHGSLIADALLYLFLGYAARQRNSVRDLQCVP